MVTYRMGLDVGTNSLGWSVLELNGAGEPCAVKDAGVRIFNDGRDDKSKATLKADRREARLARRRRDRFKQRQIFLLDVLRRVGLFPKDENKCKTLQLLNPLELRAKALSQKLDPYHIGRALFHLNQRRGFKSNRKDRSEETTSGKVSKSVGMLLEQMCLIDPPMTPEAYKGLSKADKKRARQDEAENRKRALEKLAAQSNLTYGSFLWQRQQDGKQTRARPGVGDNGKLYDVYPTRELYEDEFKKIWHAQARHHPALMTDKVRERIHNIIFIQRPLKPQQRGQCQFLPNEKRTFRAMPSFQRYRIYQEINNLDWISSSGKCFLKNYPAARDAIVDMMERPTLKERPTAQNAQVSFHKMKKLLKQMDLAEGNFAFNFETPKRNGLDGNQTSNIMQHEDYVGKAWHDWSLDKQDGFIDVILNGTPEQQKREAERAKTKAKTLTDGTDDDKEVVQYLITEHGLSEYAAISCMNAPLVEGTASLSLKASRLLMQKMRDCYLIQSDATIAVARKVDEFVNPLIRASRGELLPELPYYGEAFGDGRHIIPGDRQEADRHDDLKYYGGVTNPTVHIALNQIRHVVNELIHRYGHPKSIAIELARDLPAGKEGRAAINKEQTDNQNKNEKLDEMLLERGQTINSDNRLRLRLWQELDESDPNGRCCPFTGKKICKADLFSDSIEIEHLIPFSISLDDSRANKVICTRQANRDKGNRTPFEAFGNSPDGYRWGDILERSKQLPEPKRWRFQKDALEIWKRDYSDFTERHLNDTRYIGRLAKEYLSNICPFNKIDVLTGRLTALLRSHWGLNNILQVRKQETKKTRDDHRHHAVDAIVIGMTSRAMLQKVSTAANHAEKLNLPRLFEKRSNDKSPIDPWPGFRDHVKTVVDNIVVSHKPKRNHLDKNSTDGQLHNDTAYGIISGPDRNGTSEVVVRKPIKDFKNRPDVLAIRDKHLRHEFLQAFDAEGAAGVACLAGDKKIRHLRRTKTVSVIPIMDKFGKAYKAYEGDSNWGMEIYEYPKGHQKASNWDGEIISRFEANQKNFRPGQTKRPHPTARLIMRLQIDDCIEIEQGGLKQIMRIQKLSKPSRLNLAPHNEANVDARNRDNDNPFKYLNIAASKLRERKTRKVHVSPAGRASYEQRRKPRRKKE
ncbi:MAG: type II CRISPR RNA-guided endonuclease Cas9 [Nitrospira sp.]|nr:type II CRISPR RNA-guided endonuclease Cas9 [Nitrospira sp.]